MSTHQDAGIVTPEAVRLDFEDANVGTRAVAIAIDWLIMGAAIMLLLIAMTLLMSVAPTGVAPAGAIIIVTVAVFVVLFGYPLAFEVAWRGRTPGKAAMGLRVVTLEGAPVGFRHAAIRSLFGLVDFYLLAASVAVISALLSRRAQRLGDHVAGTVVIRERVAGPKPEVAEFQVPHGHEGYAQAIDVLGARPTDYEAVRAYLLRAPTLEGSQRAALAQRLAGSLAARLGHAIPQGVHPEAFLLCFAARYQQARGAAAPQAGQPGHGWGFGAPGDQQRPPAPGQAPRPAQDGPPAHGPGGAPVPPAPGRAGEPRPPSEGFTAPG